MAGVTFCSLVPALNADHIKRSNELFSILSSIPIVTSMDIDINQLEKLEAAKAA